jgi:hypothetical protein
MPHALTALILSLGFCLISFIFHLVLFSNYRDPHYPCRLRHHRAMATSLYLMASRGAVDNFGDVLAMGSRKQ